MSQLLSPFCFTEGLLRFYGGFTEVSLNFGSTTFAKMRFVDLSRLLLALYIPAAATGCRILIRRNLIIEIGGKNCCERRALTYMYVHVRLAGRLVPRPHPPFNVTRIVYVHVQCKLIGTINELFCVLLPIAVG